jgi:hypothetical protein
VQVLSVGALVAERAAHRRPVGGHSLSIFTVGCASTRGAVAHPLFLRDDAPRAAAVEFPQGLGLRERRRRHWRRPRKGGQ